MIKRIILFIIASFILSIGGFWWLSRPASIYTGSYIHRVRFNPQGNLLAVAIDGLFVQVWKIKDKELLFTLPAGDSFDWSPDGEYIASNGVHPFVYIWRISDGQEFIHFQLGKPIRHISWSPDSSMLAVTLIDKTVQIIQAQDGRLVKDIAATSGQGTEARLNTITWSPDSKTIAINDITSKQGVVQIWHAKEGVLLQTLKSPEPGLTLAIAFSNSGKLLAAGSDELIYVWRVEDSQLLYTLGGHKSFINDIAFNYNDKYLVSSSGQFYGSGTVKDTSVRLWNVQDGLQIESITEHSDLVTSVDFSPDGNIVASGGYDNIVLLSSVKALK